MNSALRNRRRGREAEKQSPLSEKQLSQCIVDLAQLLGWRSYRTWRSLHSPAGFPDLVMVRKGQLIFAELKSDKGRLTPAQQEWLDALHEVGDYNDSVRTYLWRPADWFAGRVDEALLDHGPGAYQE